MAVLTRDDVLRLAELAELELTVAEVEKFRVELSNILDYVNQLDDVQVGTLEPTNQVTGLTNVMRDDKIIDYGISREDLLSNVPTVKDGLIKVKRTLE